MPCRLFFFAFIDKSNDVMYDRRSSPSQVDSEEGNQPHVHMRVCFPKRTMRRSISIDCMRAFKCSPERAGRGCRAGGTRMHMRSATHCKRVRRSTRDRKNAQALYVDSFFFGKHRPLYFHVHVRVGTHLACTVRQYLPSPFGMFLGLQTTTVGLKPVALPERASMAPRTTTWVT